MGAGLSNPDKRASSPAYRKREQIKAAVTTFMSTADLWNDKTVVDHAEELFDEMRTLMPLKCRCAKSQREPQSEAEEKKDALLRFDQEVG